MHLLPFKNDGGSSVQFISIISRAPALVLLTVVVKGHLFYSFTRTPSIPMNLAALSIAPKF